MRTGRPIVYTSADSVFQVAAHESIVPVRALYRDCQIARDEVLVGPHAVSRVIARPFVGEPGRFVRTERRRDFSVAPPEPTVLDRLREAAVEVLAVGKISDLFAGRGISATVHTHNDLDGLLEAAGALDRGRGGLIFANLVDLDTVYGHRNDPRGYGHDLESIDAALGPILDALRPRDVLMLTADHGNDPTTPGTDHTRETVPLLLAGPRVRPGTDLGVRTTFADVGATVAEALGAAPPRVGRSVLGAAALP